MVLAVVRQTRQTLALHDRGDVYILRGLEVLGFTAQIHFAVVKLKTASSTIPSVVDEQRGRPMVAVRVDRPGRQDYVGILGLNQGS